MLSSSSSWGRPITELEFYCALISPPHIFRDYDFDSTAAQALISACCQNSANDQPYISLTPLKSRVHPATIVPY